MLLSLGLKNAVESATIYDTSSMKDNCAADGGAGEGVTVSSSCLDSGAHRWPRDKNSKKLIDTQVLVLVPVYSYQ